MSTAETLKYRPDIDGIRAVAVLLVVVFHFHLLPMLNSGFMGVDVFFVISGFLITTIVQSQLNANTFNLRTFWMHRIRRLAPALVATTALTLVAGWLWLMPAEFAKLAQQTIAAQLYYANIFYWRNVNYFGLQAHDVYLLHTWSLAVEEQFYVLFPLLLLAVATWARHRLFSILTLLALSSFLLNVGFVSVKPEATFYLMPTRAWELLVGSLLALYVMRQQGGRPRAAQVSGVAGLVCLGISIFAYREDTAFPGSFALWPVAAGALLILSGSFGPSITGRLLSLRPLVYVGKISYPLYLVHWPVNVFAAAALGDRYAWGWRLTMLLLSAALASLIYHGIEGPARRWLGQVQARTVLSGYMAALVGAVVLSIVVLTTDGVPSRYPDRVVKLASYARDTPPPLHECEYSGRAALQIQAMCRLGAKNVAPRWFVYGDSHAWAASGAVDEWLLATDQSALFMFVHSCPPLLGVYVFRQGATCVLSNAAALALLKDQPTVTHVLLISTWRQAKEGKLSSSPDRKFDVNESMDLFDQQFANTLEALKRMGKRIYVWEPLPGARASVPQAMARGEISSRSTPINFTRDEYRAEYAFFFDSLHKQRQLLAGTFSPSKELCGSGQCVTEVGGAPLYFDNGHLSYSLRPFWAKALERQIPGESAGTTD